jgi:sec-independent protein translocase protein TatC
MSKLIERGKKSDKEMSFLEHLEELRWHIIRSVLAIFIFMITAFVCRNIIFDMIILAPKNADFITARLLCSLGAKMGTDAICINQHPVNLINIKMAGQLTTHIIVSLVAGLILAFPVVLWELWKFFKPALKPNEIKYSKGAILITSLLFFIGVLFGYFALAPLSIHFLTSYAVSGDVVNQIYVRSYIGTITSICLATGVIFELPIVAYFLTKIGVVTPEFMRTYRRHSIVVIFILAAVITPPDVFSQILVAIPLLILYEVSIFISARVVRQREKEREAFMKDDDDDISTDTNIIRSSDEVAHL